MLISDHLFYEGRTKLVGPVVKLLLLISASGILVLWLIVGIVGSVLAGLFYGFLAPVMATFDAVGEGKERPQVHCFVVYTYDLTLYFLL